MKIGILGSGVVGQQLGYGFLRTGYEVMIGTRDTSKLNDWLKEAGDKASAGSFEETTAFGEIIVLASAWTGTENLISMAGRENFSGKIIIDATNPLDFSHGTPPRLSTSYGNSAGEQVQKWLPDAKVVKAFNTISAYIMVSPKREDGTDPDLWIAGNDDDAKKKVSEIAEQFGWKSIIDMGDLSNAYWLETFAMMWIVYGFKNNSWTHAFKLIKK